MMTLKLHSPAAHNAYLRGSLTKTYPRNCILTLRFDRIQKSSWSQVSCGLNMAAEQSDEPGKLRIGHLVEKALKVWESAPQPIKSFPWSAVADNFIQLVLNLVVAVVKYLSIPLFALTSISEMSYCAHERKLYFTPFPYLFGATVAGVLVSAALESSPLLQNAQIPWHLIVVGVLFALLKLPGPYYPYWGRILIPHFANGALLRTLWFAFLWYRRPRNPSETRTADSGIRIGV